MKAPRWFEPDDPQELLEIHLADKSCPSDVRDDAERELRERLYYEGMPLHEASQYAYDVRHGSRK